VFFGSCLLHESLEVNSVSDKPIQRMHLTFQLVRSFRSVLGPQKTFVGPGPSEHEEKCSRR